MRDWKYSTGTEETVRSALLALLAEKPLPDVSVAELCRAAHVSRSTFYEHFGNVADVYDAIVREFSTGISPVMAQVAHPGGDACAGMPFCARLREDGPFAAAVKDDRFLSAFMQKAGLLEKHDLYGLLIGAGYTPDQARAICAFQLAGCFSAARTAHVADDAWPDAKTALDRFILGGISACLAVKQARPEAPVAERARIEERAGHAALMNGGAGTMTARMHDDGRYRIIPTRIHPGGSIGPHVQQCGGRESMRRKDREVPGIGEAFGILARCDTVRIGLRGGEYPYVVPVSFGAEMAGGQPVVYFHCARQGMKLDLLEEDPRVCVEGDVFLGVETTDHGITARYESVIGFGTCEVIEDEEEVAHSLRVLTAHYGYDDYPLDRCGGLAHLRVGKIALESITGKRNLPGQPVAADGRLPTAAAPEGYSPSANGFTPSQGAGTPTRSK